MRRDVAEASQRQAMKKLADKYIGRRGEPPSHSLKRAVGKDVTADDRSHLKWCLDVVGIGIGSKNPVELRKAQAVLDFISELLDQDYNLYPERRLP